jgi:translocation and assembly module TamA
VVDLSGSNADAARIAESFRNRAPVPIVFEAELGRLFTLRRVEVRDARTRVALDPALVPPRIIRLKPGDPARAGDLRAAQIRIVDRLRARSRPLAKIEQAVASVLHQTGEIDLLLIVDPGREAGIMRMRTKKTTRTRSCQSCVNRTNSSSNQLTGSHGRRE